MVARSIAIKTSVILGATSAVAKSLARKLVENGEPVILVARNADRLAIVADDLTARGGNVSVIVSDLAQIDQHEQLVAQLAEAHTFWFFYGSLPEQESCEQSWEVAAEAIHTNFTSAASLVTRIAAKCEQKKDGHIVVVSSVAGDRGRKSNYVYGTAKGALTLFCQGVRNRLHGSGVNVLTVEPGFIDAPMTADIPKQPAVLFHYVDNKAYSRTNF